MRSYFLLGLLFFSIPCFAQLQIFFDPGSAVVPDTSRQRLLQWAEEIKSMKNPVNIFILNGYTDNTGNERSNKALGMTRSLAVKSILREAGFDEKNFNLNSFGEKQPKGDNRSAEGRQLNRRVDVLALNPPAIRAEEEEAEEEDSSDVNELFEQLRDPGQGFCIRPDRDTALVGEYGTIIYYTANTFKSAQNCSCIRIVLHEYFKKSDLVLNNLTTTSDGLSLISGGMVKLEGYCGDSLLSFDPGKYLTVMVPTDTVDERMKLLTANREKQGDILNWKLDPDFPELDFMNWDRMYWICSFNSVTVKCPFFFCKIRGFLWAVFGGDGMKKTELEKNYEKEKKLLQKYAFKEKMLGEALSKSKKNNGDILNYYVYKNASWDYKNIDMFANGEPTDFTVMELPHRSKDFKLIAKATKTILPAYPSEEKFYRTKNF